MVFCTLCSGYKGAVQQFGRYELIRRLAVGGMAELFLARSCSLDGFEKILVIKRIRADLSRDPKFYSMFIDEARISIRLSHPNIVQVFDFGKSDDSYYLAMEYIPGCDIGAVLELKSVRHRGLPPALALLVAGEVCQGLDYAHNQEGPGGEVVHRDVSPANLMVSFYGAVKVADFGIAKAKGRTTETTPGMVVGKLSYMSPEQACAKALDRRTDIYSVGLVLWEMLTGKPAYGSSIDEGFYDRIQFAKIDPPSSARPDLPPSIDQVVMRAVALNPNERYATAREFAEALRRVRVQHYPHVSNYNLEEFLQAHKQELTEIREELTESEGYFTKQQPATAAARGEAPVAAERSSDQKDGRGSEGVTLAAADLQEAFPAAQGFELSAELIAAVESFRRRPSLWTLVKMGRICEAQGDVAAADLFYQGAAVKFAQAGLLAPTLWCAKARIRLTGFEAIRDEIARLPLLHGASNQEAHGLLHSSKSPAAQLLLELLDDTTPAVGAPGAGTPLLSYLGGEAFAQFAHEARLRRFEEGATILQEGHAGSTMYLIAEGRVLVYATGAEGQRVYLSSLSSGDFFGENAFFTGAPRSANVEALYDVEAFEVDQTLYNRVMQSNPRASQILLQFYKERIVETVMAKSPVFGRLTAEDRRQLVDRFQLRVFKPGEPVLREGDLNQQIYLIKNGEAEVFTEKGGPRTRLSVIGPETVFGEVAVLRGVPRTASVQALNKLETLELSGDAFLQVLSNKPQLKQKILDVVAQRARENIDKVMGPSPFARNLS